MRLIDKNLRLFGKIHLLDLVPVLLIVLVLAGVGSKIGVGDIIYSSNTGKTTMVNIICETEPYDMVMLESIKVGDVLAEDKAYINARITSSEIIDDVVGLIDNNGKEVVDINPIEKIARIGIEIETTFEDPMYLVKSKDIHELFVGKKFYLTTQNSKLVVIVTELETID